MCMAYKRLLAGLCACAYFVGLAERFGLLVGLYVSLLVASFFILLLPTVACLATFLSLWYRGERFKRIQSWMFVSWICLLFLNAITLVFFPVIYTKTTITMFLYHMFLVPVAGVVPLAVTGISVVYYWLVARHTESWITVLMALIGVVVFSTAFYFFIRGSYFAQFIASLSLNDLNY